jgi:hypothetical protein
MGETFAGADGAISEALLYNPGPGAPGMRYSHFTTAIYCKVNDVQDRDWNRFQDEFGFIESHVHVDKVYLETYRGERFASEAQIAAAGDFFRKKGISCSGGVTVNARGDASRGFKSFCYSRADRVGELVGIIEFAAVRFDEVILDDFFFTNCKCDSCIAEKGARPWDAYRTQKMKEVSELIVRKAREANPKCRIAIKFPNWYDDYQFTGYNLRDQREIHGSIYTGTETRDPALTQQNLPRYLSYFLMRYLENASPGRNGGGWFDPFDCSYNLNSYLEQAYLTLFAKAREATLFCLGALLGQYRRFVPLAGFAFEEFDRLAGELGDPRGIACYKPFNSAGDNYMLPALGMMGIPLEPTPFFPDEAATLILSESAAADPDILPRIEALLKKGRTVMITSALASRLRDRGLRDIVDIEVGGAFQADRIATDMLGCGFRQYSRLEEPILFPKLRYRTNDSWAAIGAQGAENGTPVFIEAEYSTGCLLILNVPERFTDLYKLPVEACDLIRKRLTGELPVRISAPAGVGLFVYDNGAFIVESFLPRGTPVEIIVAGSSRLAGIDGEPPPRGFARDGEAVYPIDLAASCLRAFKVESA